MNWKTMVEAGGILGAVLLAVSKIKAVETLLDAEIKAWLASRPRRQLARRVSEEELSRILTHEREELETLCLLLQREYQADRVSIVEYECPKEGPTLATCTVEVREPRISSIKGQTQKLPMPPEVWSEVLRIHALPCRCLHVPDVRIVEIAALRSALLRSGVRSAYYQSLPAAPGHCGAMLSISWSEETPLDAADLAALHFSARTLAAVLRSIWAWLPAAS